MSQHIHTQILPTELIHSCAGKCHGPTSHYPFCVPTLTGGFHDLALQVQWPCPWNTLRSDFSSEHELSGSCLPLPVPSPTSSGSLIVLPGSPRSFPGTIGTRPLRASPPLGFHTTWLSIPVPVQKAPRPEAWGPARLPLPQGVTPPLGVVLLISQGCKPSDSCYMPHVYMSVEDST